ncbi:MAG: MarR family transcriptional regulator [Polynucleobacter sp.]
MKKYLELLTSLDKSNKQLGLDGMDVLLLNVIAKASAEKRILNVKDLLTLKEIASQATIHGRLKKLVDKKLVVLKANGGDARLKEVVLTKLAHNRYEMLSKVISK